MRRKKLGRRFFFREKNSTNEDETSQHFRQVVQSAISGWSSWRIARFPIFLFLFFLISSWFFPRATSRKIHLSLARRFARRFAVEGEASWNWRARLIFFLSSAWSSIRIQLIARSQVERTDVDLRTVFPRFEFVVCDWKQREEDAPRVVFRREKWKLKSIPPFSVPIQTTITASDWMEITSAQSAC